MEKTVKGRVSNAHAQPGQRMVEVDMEVYLKLWNSGSSIMA